MATKNTGKSQKSRGGGSRGENKGGQSRSPNKSDPRAKSQGQSSTNGGQREQAKSQQKGKPQGEQKQANKGGEKSGGSGGKGGGGGVMGSIRQHPLTTAAIGAGFGLLALEGVRRAVQASRQSTSPGNAKGRKNRRGDEDDDERRSQRGEDDDAPEAEDQSDDADDADEEDDEGDAGEDDDEEDDSARGEADDSGEQDDEDEEDEDNGSGSSLGSFARNSLSRLGSAMRGGSSNLSRAAGRGYDRGRDISEGGWQSSPLVICAASLAAGAALGFLLPSTKQEDRLMGKASDRVAGRLKKVSSQVVDQGKQALSDAADATAKEAEREGLTPTQLGKKVKRIAGHIRDAIADAVE